MPQVTRSYDTDMADLAYQISRSDEFAEIRQGLADRTLEDQDAQSETLDLVLGGTCRVQGDHGPEEFRWALSEVEAGRMCSILYRDYLGGA